MALRACGLREHDRVRPQRPEGSDELERVALAEHREDRDQPLGPDQAPQRRARLDHRGRVVAAVQDDARPLGDHLQAPWPLDGGEALPHRGLSA